VQAYTHRGYTILITVTGNNCETDLKMSTNCC